MPNARSLLRAGEPPEDAEARRTRLKISSSSAEERGFLTYAEINDHLPDDMVDASRSSHHSTFNDMGIQVYERPRMPTRFHFRDRAGGVPTKTPRRSGSRPVHGRPRSSGVPRPVRMYMREIGLGRASHPRRRDRNRQRIEDGPEAHDPGDLRLSDDHRRDPRSVRQGRSRRERIDELVDGLIDPNAKDEPIQELADDVEPEEEEETEGEDENAALSASLLRLKEDALARFAKINRLTRR